MVALFPDGRDFTQAFAEHPVPAHTTAELVEGAGDAEGGRREEGVRA